MVLVVVVAAVVVVAVVVVAVVVVAVVILRSAKVLELGRRRQLNQCHASARLVLKVKDAGCAAKLAAMLKIISMVLGF